MLNAVFRWSRLNRLIVVASAVVLPVGGAYVTVTLPVDVLPDLNLPTVKILTEAARIGPEAVDTLVSFPIETLKNGARQAARACARNRASAFAWSTSSLIGVRTIAVQNRTGFDH